MSPLATRSTGEHDGARDVPWATFALVAVCICVYALNEYATRRAQAVVEDRLQGAIAYLVAHPYLEPGRILAERVDPSLLEFQRRTERTSRLRRGGPAIPRLVQQSQKQQLDLLVKQAFADAGTLPVERWGFRATQFDPLALVAHVFLHERALHLTGALLLLLILGFYLETTWGSAGFCVFVLLSSVASAAAFAIGNPDFPAPLIGMSGVVASLLGAFLIRLRSIWKQPVYALVMVSGTLFLILPVHFATEWSVAAGLEQAAALVDSPGATHWATGGSFAFGLLAQLAISLFGAGAVDAVGGARAKAERATSSQFAKIDGARSAGRHNEAYGILAELLRHNPDDHEALLLMWDVALDYGRPADAAAAMLRAIRDEVKRNDAAAATDHWLELTNRGLNADAEPALLIRLALMLQRREHALAAVEALQLALAKSEGTNAAVVASRVARASRDLDPETARAAAWRALGSMDLDLEERQDLESLLGEIGSGIDAAPAVSGAATDRGAIEIEVGSRADPAPNAGDRRQREAWVDPMLAGEGARPSSAQAAQLETVEFEDLVRVGDLLREQSAGGFDRPEPIDLDLVSRRLRVVAATPLALEPNELRVEVEGGAKKRLPLAKLEAISVAAVGGLGERSVIVVDLVMNWRSAAAGELKVIRLRGDRFDARALAPGVPSPLDALRSFVVALLRESGATPLPDEPSANGMPFASFDSLSAYQGSVLGVEVDEVPS